MKPAESWCAIAAAQDKAARLDAGDLVDLGTGIGMDELVYRPAECPRVAEQGRDVAEHDAGLRIVRNASDSGNQFRLNSGHV
jgi:hypothetical protein